METLTKATEALSAKLKTGLGAEKDETKEVTDLYGYEQSCQQEWKIDKDDEYGKLKCTTLPKLDPNHTMQALTWRATEKVSVMARLRPMITDPHDVIIRVTSTTICGSDLHMFYNAIPGIGVMRDGDILGHEFMGVITDVGSSVKKFQVGDRVLSAFHINCGECEFCQDGKPTCCDCTNPSVQMGKMYQYRLSGIFGYSHLTGGYPGGQAEYVRRPFADTGLLKVPDHLPDEKVLLLTDTLGTGFHGCVSANVKEGCNVAIWGAGPVGLSAAYLAIKVFKAARVAIVDHNPTRLEKARLVGAEPINFDKVDVNESLLQMMPLGPDSCIECAGFRFPKSTEHKAMRESGIETDTPESLQEMIKICKKGGSIGLIGDFFGTCNQFPIGALMEKALSMRGGQSYCSNYWPILLPKIESGQLDTSFLFTHKKPFSEIAEGYRMMGEHRENTIKTHFVTPYGEEMERKRSGLE